MKSGKLVDILKFKDTDVSLENVMDNSRAYSGGSRDVDFLKYLIENKLLKMGEAMLKRTTLDFDEKYYTARYNKMHMESDRHFLCRAIIQEELKKFNIGTNVGLSVGNMDILRANSNYDIVTDDFSAIIDVGLTPARNYFRGLTDLKVKYYMISTYFDDYIDDIIFCTLSRVDDKAYLDAVKSFVEGPKEYTPNPQLEFEERKYYNESSIE